MRSYAIMIALELASAMKRSVTIWMDVFQAYVNGYLQYCIGSRHRRMEYIMRERIMILQNA